MTQILTKWQIFWYSNDIDTSFTWMYTIEYRNLSCHFYLLVFWTRFHLKHIGWWFVNHWNTKNTTSWSYSHFGVWIIIKLEMKIKSRDDEFCKKNAHHHLNERIFFLCTIQNRTTILQVQKWGPKWTAYCECLLIQLSY